MTEYSAEYSHKSLSHVNLTNADIPPGTKIRSSCFSREEPDSVIFPSDMTGVTFVNCNLDNIVIPPGNTLVDCSNKRFEVQNDLNDWIIDHNDDPVQLVNQVALEKLNLPIPTPDEIPDEPVDAPIDYTNPARNVEA